LTIAYADGEPEKFSRAAARWLSRLVAEAGLDLLEAQLALSALMLLQTPERERSCRILAEPDVGTAFTSRLTNGR
jgi:hypothetical protein